MGYLSEVKIIFAEQKYDTMEELFEIRKDMSMKRTYRNEEDTECEVLLQESRGVVSGSR